jgi:hypothetical protein
MSEHLNFSAMILHKHMLTELERDSARVSMVVITRIVMQIFLESLNWYQADFLLCRVLGQCRPVISAVV